ncbi:MAG: RHS repeat-associated core domain-containing protein, partial [Polyangiaceae bacterium]
AKGIYHRRFAYHADNFNEVTDSTEVRRYYGTPKGALRKLVTGGGVTSSEYDDRGFEIARTEADGATTRWVRDERGRVTEKIDPLGRRTRITRDPYGLPTLVVDPAGGALRANRDQRGNLEQLAEPDGIVTQLRTDERGLLTDMTFGNGGAEHRVFDAQGNLVEIVQANGGRWLVTYDGFGRRLSVRDPTGAVTRYAYTDRGDLVTLHDPNGGVTHYVYDGEQHLSETTTAAGRNIKLFWGGFNWLCAQRDANGHLTRLEYGRDGELVAIINARDEVHRLAYDKAGKLIEEDTFDGRRLRYRNDATGRVIRAENGAGEITTFAYDAAGQLVEIGLPDESTTTFKYDDRGDLVEAVCKAGSLLFERNAGGRVVRETQSFGGADHWVEVAYDGTGERIGRKTSLGFAERVERDAMGTRVRTVLDGVETIEHESDLVSREILRRLPKGGTIESKFDAMGHLTERFSRTTGAGPMVGRDEPDWIGRRDDGTSSRTAYRYDIDGLLASAADSAGGVTTYEHDPMKRLLAVLPEKARAELFRYDPTWNPFEAGAGDPERDYGRGNRLLRRGSTEYVWDDDGRLAEKRETQPDGVRRWRYTWSGILLESVETPEGKRIDFAYDPFARRMIKRVLVRHDTEWDVETSMRFVWDANWLVHEIPAHGTPVTYLFSDNGLDPTMQGSNGRWLHFLNDPSGAPKRLIDGAGKVAGEVDTSVWGTGGGATTPLRFQGQYADAETGLHYNRFRYYDPETARFMSPDPYGPATGLNQYAYAPTPLTYIDGLGLFATGSNENYGHDAQGRLSTVTATIRPQDLHTGSGTNESSRAEARRLGHSGDDAGHIIGNRLGGSGGVGHVFGQDPHTNRGAFRDHEAWVASQVDAGHQVDVRVTMNYTGNQTRPSSVSYETFVNGVSTNPRTFPNP